MSDNFSNIFVRKASVHVTILIVFFDCMAWELSTNYIILIYTILMKQNSA